MLHIEHYSKTFPGGKKAVDDLTLHVRPGQIVVDVSINWDEAKGGIAGDAVFEEVEPIVDAITPVPGGVGSVTTSICIGHVVEAAKRSLD